jgi:hypothetical protein
MGIHAQFRLANRRMIEDEIERLIALLDAEDGDPDLEPEQDHCLASDEGLFAICRDGVRASLRRRQSCLTVPRTALSACPK